MNTKLKAGNEFVMGNVTCLVSCIDKFANTPHYGFTYRDDNGNYFSGWMPIDFVDKFCGGIDLVAATKHYPATWADVAYSNKL